MPALTAAPLLHTQAPIVKLLVGYTAGGPVDGSARQFAPLLARELWSTVTKGISIDGCVERASTRVT